MSHAVVLVPTFSEDICDTAHASLDICSSSNFYNFSRSQAFRAIGETNALSVLRLTDFMSAQEAMQTQPCGFENIGFGPVNSDTALLWEQAVAGVTSSKFMHGVFGLSNEPPDLSGIPFKARTGTTLNATLATFQSAHLVASNSFSYTAGSIGRNSTPSLVFGGHDTSRVTPGSILQVDIRNISTP
jgi:hypothetical protein